MNEKLRLISYFIRAYTANRCRNWKSTDSTYDFIPCVLYSKPCCYEAILLCDPNQKETAYSPQWETDKENHVSLSEMVNEVIHICCSVIY